MEDGKCKKQYAHKFQSETVTDLNGYPIYRCRDMGRTILVHDIELDNRWVVPYLSTKYDAHINVEICNNICAIKYLFKYVYKGHDHATVEISRQSNNATEGNMVKANEIKKYFDCRYVSTSIHSPCSTQMQRPSLLIQTEDLPISNSLEYIFGSNLSNPRTT